MSFTWIVWIGNSKFVNYLHFNAFSSQKEANAFSSQKEARTCRKQYTRFLMGDQRVKVTITWVKMWKKKQVDWAHLL